MLTVIVVITCAMIISISSLTTTVTTTIMIMIITPIQDWHALLSVQGHFGDDFLRVCELVSFVGGGAGGSGDGGGWRLMPREPTCNCTWVYSTEYRSPMWRAPAFHCMTPQQVDTIVTR